MSNTFKFNHFRLNKDPGENFFSKCGQIHSFIKKTMIFAEILIMPIVCQIDVIAPCDQLLQFSPQFSIEFAVWEFFFDAKGVLSGKYHLQEVLKEEWILY